MKTDHIPQGIFNPTTYKEAEKFAVELGAVATRTMITRDEKIYSTYFFNNQEEEVLNFSHILTCIYAFDPPRKWHKTFKEAYTPLTRIKYFGYKLFNQRKDGSLGPLFINRKQRIEVGVEYRAEDHLTKGYKHRPGWHILLRPYAPHLKQDSPRVWAKVEYCDFKVHERPGNQGGTWVLANFMRVVEIIDE